MTTPLQRAAANILDQGYAVISLEASVVDLLQSTFSDASLFFREPNVEKVRFSGRGLPKHLPGFLLEGYRPLGDEYSQSADRPDLNESFAVWQAHSGDPTLSRLMGQCKLHGAMTSLLAPCRHLADALLEAIRLLIAPAGTPIRAGEPSYLQLNSYRPKAHSRELLQEEHEDGQLLTLLKPTRPGLQIRTRLNTYESLFLGESEIVVMPGSLLTWASGGRIEPLYHRVINDKVSETRQSLIYFVNPDITGNIDPWILNDQNRHQDIKALTIHSSTKFGLPSIEHLVVAKKETE